MHFYVVFGRIAADKKFKPVFVIPDGEKIDEKIKSSISMLVEVNVGGFYDKFITREFEAKDEDLL